MKILILDDHEAIRFVIKQQILELVPSAEIIEYTSVEQAQMHFSERLAADYLISDLELTSGCNVSLIETAHNMSIPTLVFSSHVNKVLIGKLEGMRVKCYVAKTSGMDALKLGIQALLNNKSYYCPKVTQTRISTESQKETEVLVLTNGQKRVLHVLSKGFNRKDAASQLKITPTTVNNQIAKARELNDCESFEELLRRYRFWDV